MKDKTCDGIRSNHRFRHRQMQQALLRVPTSYLFPLTTQSQVGKIRLQTRQSPALVVHRFSLMHVLRSTSVAITSRAADCNRLLWTKTGR